MAARGIVAKVETAARDLGREGSEGAVVRSDGGRERALDSFALFGGAALIDENRRAGRGQCTEQIALDTVQTISMGIEPFTLIGATTRLGMLTPPMRGRFGIEQRLNFYPAEDLELIVRRTAEVMKVEIENDGARGGREDAVISCGESDVINSVRAFVMGEVAPGKACTAGRRG